MRLVEVGIEPTAFGFMGRRSATELLSVSVGEVTDTNHHSAKNRSVTLPFHAVSAPYTGCVLMGKPCLKNWRGNKRYGVAFRRLILRMKYPLTKHHPHKLT